MSNIPQDLLYTKEHEWLKVEGDKCTFGITHHAQEQMGDIVYVELPEEGDEIVQFEDCGVVESVKTASDLFAPVSGEVMEANAALLQEIDGEDNENFHPEYINEDPYGKGWILKVKLSDESELEKLLSPEEYKKLVH